MTSNPAASIIISAYNRPHVVAFAIKSVLNSDFDDWEMIVVGDGCNEATENAVKAFVDPRIRFFNLPENTGSQSEPHNAGVRQARGRYVLFLNQDDMYFPDHISESLRFMEASGADIAWSPILLLQHSHSESGPIDPSRDVVTLDGTVERDRFDPTSFIISSSWVVRREVCDAVGPWLAIEKTRLSPSQEWLYRAYRQGRRMAYHRNVSVLCIHSGVRRHSYLVPRSIEHERAWSWIEAGPAERFELLNCVAVQLAAEVRRLRSRSNSRRRLVSFVEASLTKLGVHPHAAQRFFSRVGKGRWVSEHRRFTSEPPEIPVDAAVNLGDADAERFLGKGWHAGEGRGRWTAKATAEIFFSLPRDAGSAGFLELSGHPLRRPETVSFALNDGETIGHVFEGGEATVRLPVNSSGPIRLTVTVERPSSPRALGLSADERTLGFWASSMRVVRDLPATTPL